MKILLNFSLILSLILSTSIFNINIKSDEPYPANRPTDSPLFNIRESNSKTLRIDFRSPSIALEKLHQDGIFLSSLFQSTGVLTSDKYPGVPYFSSIILLPPDNSIPEIKIEQIEKDSIPIDFDYVSGQYRASISEEQTTGYMETFKLPLTDINLPQEIVAIDNIAWFRNYRIATLKLYPITFDPDNNVLEWYKFVSFKFDFQPNSLTSQYFTPKVFSNAVDKVVLNSNMVPYWRGIPDNAVNQLKLESSLGSRYKFSIFRTGIYSIPYTTIVESGISPESITRDNIHIYNQGEEISIWPYGLEDNSFDPGDYILFYGERFSGTHLASRYQTENNNWYTFTQYLPDGTTQPWKPQINKFFFEKYTNENVYWLVIDNSSQNLRMPVLDANPVGNPESSPDVYTTTVHIEKPEIYWTYHFTSEDTFVWSYLTGSTITYTIELISPIASNISSTLKGAFVARSNNPATTPDHKLDLLLNGNLVDTVQWDGKSRYEFEKAFRTSYLEPNNELQINKILNSQLYTDWFEIIYARPFIAINDALTFTKSITTNSTTITITGFTTLTNAIVLDVTDGHHPIIMTGTRQINNNIAFTPQDIGNLSFAVYNNNSITQINSLSSYNPPDLYSATNQGDYIIISPSEFITTSLILADYRQAQGFHTRVISLDDIINEFGDGIYHPIAIKNFIRYSMANWSIPPVYVILIGDGDWALQKGNPYYGINKTYMPPYLSLVDPWQGEVDSANLLATVIGDDPLADVIISRIPVNSSGELETVIEKIIRYESSPYENWAQNSLFIADNVPDAAGDFVSLSEDIINRYTYPKTHISPIRLYQNDYNCSSGKYDPDCTILRHEITNTINISGAVTINYIGHGSATYWSGENIFTTDMITSLNNPDKLPIILSMTCLDGVWQYPESGKHGPGLVEYTLRYPYGGSVGAFSPTGLGVTTGHDVLHRGFYESLFADGDWRLGDAAMLAKLRLYETGAYYDLLHTFTIFGDPAMEIKNPFNLAGTPNTQVKEGYINNSVSFTYSITNTGFVTDAYLIEIAHTDWPLSTMPYSITEKLTPGQSTEISVTVDIPPTVSEDDTGSFTLEVISESNLYRKAVLTGEVIAHKYQIYLPSIHH